MGTRISASWVLRGVVILLSLLGLTALVALTVALIVGAGVFLGVAWMVPALGGLLLLLGGLMRLREHRGASPVYVDFRPSRRVLRVGGLVVFVGLQCWIWLWLPIKVG